MAKEEKFENYGHQVVCGVDVIDGIIVGRFGAKVIRRSCERQFEISQHQDFL